MLVIIQECAEFGLTYFGTAKRTRVIKTRKVQFSASNK